jgi:ATP-dependent Clp protease ATP-binding subunit ClpC
MLLRILEQNGVQVTTMFERYTESARRVLFFSRYESSQLGATMIEPEHILLGIIRDNQGPVARLLELSQVAPEVLRTAVEDRAVLREKIPTSVEIPFSPQTKRVLQFTAEEADRVGHRFIGTEHLFVGLLREPSGASTILEAHGLHLDDVRTKLATLLAE